MHAFERMCFFGGVRPLSDRERLKCFKQTARRYNDVTRRIIYELPFCPADTFNQYYNINVKKAGKLI